MTRARPVWQDASSHSDSDSESEVKNVGYSRSKGYWQYTGETFARWFCRCCGRRQGPSQLSFLPTLMCLALCLCLPAGEGYELRSALLSSGRTISYAYRPSPLAEADARTVLMIHPVGVGIAGWFYNNMMRDDVLPSCNLLVPDLWGCGKSALLDPAKEGISLPTDWVRDCEAVCGDVQGGLVVVAQGGIAPVGLQLAQRGNVPVKSLILTSPPVYDDLVKPIGSGEFGRNLQALQFFKGVVRILLCRRSAIEFFSNLFLFAGEADDSFLSLATKDAQSRSEQIEPVLIFNAGGLTTRSWAEEIAGLGGALRVVSGAEESGAR